MPGNNPTFKCPKFHTFLVSSCWILISTSRQRKFVFNAKTGSTPFAAWKHDLRLNCIELVEFVVKLISSKHSLLRRCPSLRCPIRRSSRGMETLIFFYTGCCCCLCWRLSCAAAARLFPGESWFMSILGRQNSHKSFIFRFEHLEFRAAKFMSTHPVSHRFLTGRHQSQESLFVRRWRKPLQRRLWRWLLQLHVFRRFRKMMKMNSATGGSGRRTPLSLLLWRRWGLGWIDCRIAWRVGRDMRKKFSWACVTWCYGLYTSYWEIHW